MRNRRTIKEANKEHLIRSRLKNRISDKIKVDRPAFFTKQARDEPLSSNSFPYSYGVESSSLEENELRYKLLSDLETCKNILEKNIDSFYAKHRSFVNGALLAEQQFKKIEKDANREILMSLRDDPFSFGFTEEFETYENVDFSRSSTEVFRDKVLLASNNYEPSNLEVRNITTNVSVSNGILNDVSEVSSSRNVLEKDGSSFKTKVIANSPQATVELEVVLELQTETNIDRLTVSSLSIENNDLEGISVSYSKNGLEFFNPVESTLERLQSQTNIFDIYDTDIKVIKVRFFKYAADRTENFINEYIYSIDHIGLVSGNFIEEGEFYSKAIKIVDEDGNPVNFSSASIRTGTCCIVPSETSISFFLSKDGENYLSANFFGESNDVVSFSNQINRNIFQQIDSSAQDLINFNSRLWKINNYLPSAVEIIPGSLEILRNVGEWVRISNSFEYGTTIRIDNVEGQSFDLGPHDCLIDGLTRSGIVFLEKGDHSIITSRYREVTVVESESSLTEFDNLYPYNHKYVFEGYKYPKNFLGNRVYGGVKTIFETRVEVVEKEFFDANLDKRNLSYSESDDTGTYFYLHKASNNTQEEIFINCKLNDDLVNNNIYIKAILKSNNPSRSPRIDSIQVRVI
jgi:hypothetical protein